jgi:hypothetical protein
MLSFHDLEMKFGPAVAMQCLAEIEKAARIPSWTMNEIDPETRLAMAIHAQDALAA